MAPPPRTLRCLTDYPAAYEWTPDTTSLPTALFATHARAAGPIGMAVSGAWALYADPQTGAYPLDVDQNAQAFGLAPAHVVKALQRLAAVGLITIEECGGDTETGMPP